MSDGYKAHLFICTNAPDKDGKCGSKGAEDLRKELKDRCRNEFGKEVRVNSAGCLGYCERGIAAVIYPQNKWMLQLTNKDSDQIFDALKAELEKSKP